MQNLNDKTLIVITDNYPFGKGEEFFETEIEYLVEKFDKVIIVSYNSKDEITRKVPDGVEVYRYDSKKNRLTLLNFIKYIFSKTFRKELKFIKETYCMKLDCKKVISLLIFMLLGESFLKFLNNIIEINNLSVKNRKLFLYTYWLEQTTYAISKIRRENNNVYAISRTHRVDLYFEENKQGYLPLRNYIIEGLDRLFFISDNGKTYFEDKLKIKNENKFKVSKLGINNICLPSKSSCDKVVRIVSCSFVIQVKRIDLIIDVLSQIDGYDVQWTHIGDGNDFEKIKAYAQEKLLKNSNIKFEFKGHMTNKEIYRFYENREIDIFISLSASEGIPVSMMEAFSFGIPIIATNVGGVSEIVNSKNGVLISSDPAIDEIKNAISIIRQYNKEQIKQLRLNAYETWKSKYNACRNYTNFTQELSNIK